jgi:hypothetical protein
MKFLLRVVIMAAAAISAYELCANASILLWARSAGPLKITQMTASGWSNIQISGRSPEARSVRTIVSRPRIWFPTFVGFVPQLLASSKGVAIGISGNMVFGGGGVLGGGGCWVLFPSRCSGWLTPHERLIFARWEQKRSSPFGGGKLGGS